MAVTQFGAGELYVFGRRASQDADFYNPTQSEEDKRQRHSYEYQVWRATVLLRDNYTCCRCGNKRDPRRNVYLVAHHIKRWSIYPALRFDVDNGETLCNSCHWAEHHSANNRNQK